MASFVRLAIGFMTMLVCSSLYAGNTESPAPIEPPAQESAPAAPAPVSVTPAPPLTIHLAQPVAVAPVPVMHHAAPAPDLKNYVGIGLGPTHFGNSGVTGYNGCDADTRDTGYKIFAGRHLGGPFAIEAAYVDLGGMSVSGCRHQAAAAPAADTDHCGLCEWPIGRAHPEHPDEPDHVIPAAHDASFNQNLHVHGLTVAGVVSAPVLKKPLSVFAKAGAFFWWSHSDGDFGSYHATGTSPVYGLGLQYDFGRVSAVRLEAERYDRAGETAYQTHPDVNMTSVSYMRRF